MESMKRYNNKTPLVNWTLYKTLVNANSKNTLSTILVISKEAEQAALLLIKDFPKESALQSVLVYIRQTLKSPSETRAKMFLNKSIEVLKQSYQ